MTMCSSKDLHDFEEAWKEFLRRLERIWNKTEAHFMKSQKWNGWNGKYLTLRKSDPLLCYLVNARCADEHTVAVITAKTPGSIGINPSQGDFLHIRRMTITPGKIFVDSSQPISVDFIPGKVQLLPVVNRGRKYPVPASHLGRSIESDDVLTLAELGVSFYEEVLQKADVYFVKT